ncbi:MAG: D-2-hydroxyacid dehydrogenase [Caldilineaceae bacterium]|nr:D-2-hydroxyacid dehydrogenase [Caldilineaceae bacterium]
MPQPTLPDRNELTICFAHVAYQMEPCFAARETGIDHFQVWSVDDLFARIGEADVLVVSGFWRNELLDRASKLRFIQSIGAGVDQFDQAELRNRGIRLASARGVNKNAVSEHAMAQILAFARHIHTGRDNQHKRVWRGMLSDLSIREDELGGKTLLIVGMGDIGSRLAKLAKAFDMHVIATKRNPATAQGPADEVYTADQLPALVGKADYVALTCPLTPETENLIDASIFSAMKPSAYLINMARGRVVNEPDLIAALQAGEIAGAGLDTTWEEPLPEDSPLWAMENVIITPHTAGETRKYEENVLDILLENLDRLWQGEEKLLNQIV